MSHKSTRRTFNHLVLSSAAACLLERAPATASATTTHAETGFAHPGMLQTKSDIVRMRNAVKAAQQPILSGFEKLRDDPGSRKTYQSKGAYAEVGRNPNVHADEFNKDCNASYQCAVLWCVTGDRAYFDIARGILTDWAKTLKSITGVDAVLCAGLGPFLMANAAELLRHAGTGWSPSESAAFGRMLQDTVLPVIENFASFANGNWDTAALKTMMAIAIYNDDPALFDRALTYYVHGCGDGRLANYIYPTGQCQESGRDQAHTQLGIAHMGDCCEMAWNQGVDLYGYLDNRLLAGFEYTARYNLGGEVPFMPDVDRTGKYRHAVISPRGPLRPVYEQIHNHYVQRRGLPAPYTRQAAEKLRPEGAGFQADQTGFGTLLYSRPPLDMPPTGGAPAALRAEQSSGVTELSFVSPIGYEPLVVERSDRSSGGFKILSRGVTGSSYHDASGQPGKLYYYRVRGSRSGRSSPVLAHMAGLPRGWQDGCLGVLPGRSNVAFDGVAFRLTAFGTASNDATADFYSVHQALSPSGGAVFARLLPPIAAQGARMGIGLLTAGASTELLACLVVMPSSGPAEHPRWTASLLQNVDGTFSSIGSLTIPPPSVTNGRILRPIWMRLEHLKSACRASVSVDGTDWLRVGDAVLSASASRAGLLLNSGAPDIETELSFDQFTVQSSWDGQSLGT